MFDQTLILSFGYYDRESPRYRSVRDAVTNGGTVRECHTEMKGLFAKYRDLTKKFRALAGDAGTVLVPFPGHALMPLAWWLTRRPRRRLIFDAFLSLYDTDVADRRRYARWNPWAWMLWLIDWLSMHLADEVLIDTNAHRDFLIRTFFLQPERVRVIYLEARHDMFFPSREGKREGSDIFRVFFYGTLIPLQGIDVILEAARMLGERNAAVHFTFAGSSKLQSLPTAQRLRNSDFHPFVPMRELADMIRGSDVCLGIFGTSDKAQRVIPHKVVDALACEVPVITADTPAIRERYAENPLVHRIPAGNAVALSDAIERLRAATR